MKNKYYVEHLIDVVSKNPDDYTLKDVVFGENEIEAVKNIAIHQTSKSSSNIKWIKNIKGSLDQVLNELMMCNYVFGRVIEMPIESEITTPDYLVEKDAQVIFNEWLIDRNKLHNY